MVGNGGRKMSERGGRREGEGGFDEWSEWEWEWERE